MIAEAGRRILTTLTRANLKLRHCATLNEPKALLTLQPGPSQFEKAAETVLTLHAPSLRRAAFASRRIVRQAEDD
jgi:hypothetical protein